MVRVRDAKPEDASRIIEMSAAVSAHEGLPSPALTAEALVGFAFHQRLLDICLAEAEGGLVGHVVTTRSFDVQAGAPTRWMCDLYVEPSFRGRGIGRRLIGAVSQHAIAEGAAYLQWLMTPDNDAAVRFYKSIGARRDGGIAMFLRREEMATLAAVAEA
jgi:ribosomal protein S18 acetylase RimI-like enzyme